MHSEYLPDPLDDRVVTEVLPPPNQPLDNKILFPTPGKPDWIKLKEFLAREGKIKKSDLQEILNLSIKIFKKEPNILEIKDPLVIVGDIHGQYYDLLTMFDVGGSPESTQYLFLGDYVDRGPFSVECMLLLLSLKINYPSTIWLIRGNHECRQLTSYFNFKQECN